MDAKTANVKQILLHTFYVFEITNFGNDNSYSVGIWFHQLKNVCIRLCYNRVLNLSNEIANPVQLSPQSTIISLHVRLIWTGCSERQIAPNETSLTIPWYPAIDRYEILRTTTTPEELKAEIRWVSVRKMQSISSSKCDEGFHNVWKRTFHWNVLVNGIEI